MLLLVVQHPGQRRVDMHEMATGFDDRHPDRGGVHRDAGALLLATGSIGNGTSDDQVVDVVHPEDDPGAVGSGPTHDADMAGHPPEASVLRAHA